MLSVLLEVVRNY